MASYSFYFVIVAFLISTRENFCQGLIFSNLEYCVSSWYPGLSCTLRGSLDTFQRKCARFVLNLGPRSHIGSDEFSALSWLPFSRRVMFFNLVHTFKVRSGCSPAYLSDDFYGISTVHSHNVRQSRHNLSLAHCSSPPGTFIRKAITDWNSLPPELKDLGTLQAFKTGLKRFLQQ